MQIVYEQSQKMGFLRPIIETLRLNETQIARHKPLKNLKAAMGVAFFASPRKIGDAHSAQYLRKLWAEMKSPIYMYDDRKKCTICLINTQ